MFLKIWGYLIFRLYNPIDSHIFPQSIQHGPGCQPHSTKPLGQSWQPQPRQQQWQVVVALLGSGGNPVTSNIASVTSNVTSNLI